MNTNTSSRIRAPLLVGTGLAVILPVQAQAQGIGPDFDARVEFNVIQSDLNFDQGEGLDSSGFGAQAFIGADFDLSDTLTVRAEGSGQVFEYDDDDRGTRKSVGGKVSVEKQVSETVAVEVSVRNAQNIGVLEATSADQTSVLAQVEWGKGNDRIRVNAEYREREYDTTTAGHGEGYRVYGQYRRRFGSYHWAYIAARHEDMKSDDEPRRSYDRQVIDVKYSHPVAKRVRILPSLEYRQWKYDARVARGDPNGDLRKDHYIAPAVELAWGRADRGLYANAAAEYRFRSSNDERYDEDAIRLEARVGYRF